MNDKAPIYLDYAATTPLDPRVLDAMLPYFKEHFGNAGSSTHTYGWSAKGGVQSSRRVFQDYFNCSESEIVFTSGATESINLALKGGFELMRDFGNHIITAKNEHKAVLDTCAYLEKQGAEVTYLETNESGQISLQELRASITSETVMISLMWVNNETGVINPVAEIGAIAKENNVFFFTDATQALGKTDIQLKENNIAAASFSSHKIYGPKGIGALYISRKSPRFQPIPQVFGGGQENGFRGGTLNTPGIVGFAEALKIAQQADSNLIHQSDSLCKGMQDIGFVLNCQEAEKVPHILSFYHPDYKAKDIVKNTSNIAFSLGSACNSEKGEVSHVLLTLGKGKSFAENCFRVSIGRFTTPQEISRTIELFGSTVI